MALKVRDIFVSLGFDVDQKALSDLDRSLVNIQRSVKGMTILFGGASLALGGFLKVAGDFEQTEIAFETMLGSAEAAKELLDGLKEDARRTPFTLPGILEAAKGLLAIGRDASNVREEIGILGDISAGVGKDKFPRLVYAFGQVSTATRLLGTEVKQFTEAGVPILALLGKQLGKTAFEIRDMVSKGEISFDMVKKALKSSTEEGGRFFNLMSRLSQAFFGIISNISDGIIELALDIGKELLPQAKAIANEFLSLLDTNKKIIKTRLVKFFKELSKTIGTLFRGTKALIEAVLNVSEAFGGLENVIKGVAYAWIAFTGIQALSAIGSGVIALIKLFRTLGTVGLLAQAKMLLIPILVGAALVALGVIIEDIIGYFRGKDSVTGLIVDAFEKKLPDAFINTKAALLTIRDIISDTITETKLLIGFLNEMLLIRPAEAIKSIFNLDAFEGFAKAIGFGEMNPATSPVSNNNQVNQVRVNAPVTVTVPEGTPSALVGTSIKEGIKEAFDDMIRQSQRQLSPVIE